MVSVLHFLRDYRLKFAFLDKMTSISAISTFGKSIFAYRMCFGNFPDVARLAGVISDRGREISTLGFVSGDLISKF